MSYQDQIYNQNGNYLRNETGPSFGTSSDICIFNMPLFTMSGASIIDCTGATSGLTVADSNVYALTGQSEIEVALEFTANTQSFVDNDASFRFEVYKYNHDLGFFQQPAVYQSEEFQWSGFSGTSAFTTTIPVDDLNVDGDYLIKGYYIHSVCTEFASLLGNNYSTSINITGDEYGIYQPDRDFYFVAFNSAETPQIESSADNISQAGLLNVISFIVENEETQFSLPANEGDYLIALNGLTLAKDIDYAVTSIDENNIATTLLNLSAATVNGDIITAAYTSSEDFNNIVSDTIDIDSAIVSGATDGEGSNSVYYNTDTGKYELFLDNTPANPNDIVVTLNGATLALNIDYYQSVSNPKRIILEGDLYVGDLINVFYMLATNIQGNVYSNNITITWSVDTAPVNEDGTFTLEVSSAETFTTLVASATTDYVIGQNTYFVTIDTVGEVGDVLYYRVKNEKNYEYICDNVINTTVYSEIISITIQTNANNSY